MRAISKLKGFALIAAMVVTTLLLMLGGYLANSMVSEVKISKSQSEATKTYYLAETGINEMINKIKNDAETRTAFLNGTLSNADLINRTNIYNDPNAAYTVSVRSLSPAYAEIIATSTYQISGSVSRRVIKTTISKSTNSPVSWPNSVVSSGGNITFSGNNANFNLNGGKMHTNNQLILSANNVLLTINNGVLSAGEAISVTGNNDKINTQSPSYASAPTSTEIALPQIDFNSGSASSWKNRATTIYTYSQFKSLVSTNATRTLNGIIYVTGSSATNSVTGNNVNLTVNGVLVFDGGVKFGGNNLSLNINANATHPEYGSGLLVNGNLIMGGNNFNLNITGLIYSNANIQTANNLNLSLNGGIVANSLTFGHSNSNVNINFNESNVLTPLAPALNTESPIIKIDHWEEQY